MEFRNIGSSGLKVSVVGLGTNNFGFRIGAEEASTVLDRALDLGITHIDTADMYGRRGGSEAILGELLGARRQDVVLATKTGFPMDDAGQLQGASRHYLMRAVEASLKRLRTDWIDIYYIHRFDPETPIEETLRALDDLIRQGKVRYVGCSNFEAWRIAEAHYVARELGTHRFICTQDEYNLLARQHEDALIPAAAAFGLGFIPYYPLAGGALSGKYLGIQATPQTGRLGEGGRTSDRYLSPANVGRTERLDRFAKERGHSLLELAMSWLAGRPQVASVIAGATRPEQVEANCAAIGWTLTEAERAEIDQLLAP